MLFTQLSDMVSDVSSISSQHSKHRPASREYHLSNGTSKLQSVSSTNEEIYSNSNKKQPDSPRKSNGSWQKQLIPSNNVPQTAQNHTRPGTRDLSPMRGRSNTDVQSFLSLSNNIKQQHLALNNPGSDRAVHHHHHHHPKPKSTLPPSSLGQPGYVAPSKLFNMMAYGLQNQYLFMLSHYLYIIDCRTKDQFKENHIITAIHWEDALNGTVYISVVERFSEIVLYDNEGLFFNTTAEMSRIMNRFNKGGSKICLILSGGFEAFQNSFPFVCTQSDIRTTVDREKFLTIYPSVILDNQLYLGTGHQATNWKVIRDLKITHIINISFEHQCVFPDKIKYLHLQLEDMEDVLLKDRFTETIQFMTTAFENASSRILVHCNLGISRSTTVTLAYLMKTYNATASEAFKFVRKRRPIVCPNLGFLRQLIDYEYELFGHIYSDLKDPVFH
ncbi:unnamed protein product [Adineta ricciae]|uniref:protein-tyrosine-phosphatase n=1 Tax=Adineta ricciae TaxID=249248 RepID=A0A813V0M8_ADIRI|nr:unnamed protein product [Adineta ricciae]